MHDVIVRLHTPHCVVQGTVHILDRALRAPALAADAGDAPADQAGAEGEGSTATEPEDAEEEMWDAARTRAGAGPARTGRGGWQAARRARGERASLRLMRRRWACGGEP